MLHETIDQLCIEAGRRFRPTEEIIALAQRIVTEKCNGHESDCFPQDYVYDIESYPNFFSCSITHAMTFRRWRFEISEYVDQSRELYDYLISLTHIQGARMVGFNNLHYDYPVLHYFIENQGYVNYAQLKQRSNDIFNDHSGRKFQLWENQHFIPQVDLMKIHHFDNKAKMTGLKTLEMNMRSENIKDLPYDPNERLTREQALEVLDYNDHDVDETLKFYKYSLPMIRFRYELNQKYPDKNFTNFNDTKIGKEFFVMKLNESGIVANNRTQTKRSSVNIGEVLLPYISFEHPEFQRILNFFRGSTVDKLDKNGMLEMKGFFKGVSANIDGFDYDFGAGGIHGSLHKTIVRESETHALIDIDVASYYPNLAIANGFYPEHLTDKFCEVYQQVYNMRKSYAKGTAENAMLKLALNGVYGASNDKFSPFLDPKYTLATTVNGQLLLCMLAEQLMKIPNLKMVQINTDGLTYLCPREYVDHTMNLKTWWEQLTNLELERADYKMIAIRDVNSYLAVTTDGKVKRIGAYASELACDNPATRELAWHKNQSAVIVALAAEQALVNNTPIEQFIRGHEDDFDFMLSTKVPRSSRLELQNDIHWQGVKICKQREVIQNISRYVVAKQGKDLVKVMPPTEAQITKWREGEHWKHRKSGDYKVRDAGKGAPSGMYDLVEPNSPYPPHREMRVEAGWLVKDCSDVSDFNRKDINYDYYINETRKLVDELLLNEVKLC